MHDLCVTKMQRVEVCFALRSIALFVGFKKITPFDKPRHVDSISQMMMNIEPFN